MYLGLDIEIFPQYIEVSQNTFIKERLHAVSTEELYDRSGKFHSAEKQLPMGRQMVGSLMWILQTRVDMSHHICVLATSMHSSVKGGEVGFREWINMGGRLVGGDSKSTNLRQILFDFGTVSKNWNGGGVKTATILVYGCFTFLAWKFGFYGIEFYRDRM